MFIPVISVGQEKMQNPHHSSFLKSFYKLICFSSNHFSFNVRKGNVVSISEASSTPQKTTRYVTQTTLESRIIVYTRNLILKFFRDTRSYSGHARSRLAERFGEEKFQIFNFLSIFFLENFWKMNLFIMDLHMHYAH